MTRAHLLLVGVGWASTGMACARVTAPADPGMAAVGVAAGFAHSCALTAGGEVWCWGWGERGQLAVDTPRVSSPVRAPVEGIAELAAGKDNTCAIRMRDRGVVCWGSNLVGQLGVKGQRYVFSPVEPFPGRVVRQVSANHDAICIITDADAVECRGNDSYFALTGSRALADSGYPRRYRSVFVGPLSYCAVSTDARAYCWGDNNVGQLRRDTLGDRIARPIWMADSVSSIAVERSYSCAVLLDGGLRCWGREFPDDSSRVELGPQVGRLTGIAMGVLTTWLLNEDGEVWSLGHALQGVRTPDARAINTAFRAREITAGFSHACALADHGDVWCWGTNGDGEVGTDRAPSREPERVFP